MLYTVGVYGALGVVAAIQRFVYHHDSVVAWIVLYPGYAAQIAADPHSTNLPDNSIPWWVGVLVMLGYGLVMATIGTTCCGAVTSPETRRRAGSGPEAADMIVALAAWCPSCLATGAAGSGAVASATRPDLAESSTVACQQCPLAVPTGGAAMRTELACIDNGC